MEIACYIRCDATFAQVQDVLGQAGFQCHRFVHDTSLLRAQRRQAFKLVLADVASNAADDDQFEWLNCRGGESTPVVMIANVENATAVTRALQAGADSCVYFPYEVAELPARLHAVLRRQGRRVPQHRIIEVGDFKLNRDTGILWHNGAEVELTPREFMMAWVFFSAPGDFLSRDAISMAVWGIDSEITNRTIEQHIYKLRRKLNLCAENGAWIRTAYTKGYCLHIKAQNDAAMPEIEEELEAA